MLICADVILVDVILVDVVLVDVVLVMALKAGPASSRCKPLNIVLVYTPFAVDDLSWSISGRGVQPVSPATTEE